MTNDEAEYIEDVAEAMAPRLSDPTCPPEELAGAVSFFAADHPCVAAALSNPNLPAPVLGLYLRAGRPSAWLNPAVDMYLLEHPLDASGLLFHGLLHGLCRAALSTMNEARMSDYSPHLRLARMRARMAGQSGPFWDRWRATLESLLDQTDPSDL